ncbi:MAG: hypothetical protein A3G60_02245 [Candidatus Ryanbacteria bacterium RIFCSPLOWO2_12_FULL_47_9c]|uniref:Uncharacterized protein n=1 Tax=Candidatus Ryanbacteria bacterium RIFCSPLOWO2_12_FULL_47_9c TaxID=1802131 RepID=A0A1G2H243_9BACT|nr:MAG: hypothetical protein A3G60_02245 [Candidatus Ryanbacteria bacterium RIFCSPLOWO2_12_FULL_47_9c]
MFPMIPVVELLESETILIICWPEDRETFGMETAVQVCQPPVFGMVMVPVLFTPLNSIWKVPPAPDAATWV